MKQRLLEVNFLNYALYDLAKESFLSSMRSFGHSKVIT